MPINFPNGEISGSKLQEILSQQASGLALSKDKITTLQDNLNQLIPGFAALLLTFLCMWLLKKKVNQLLLSLDYSLLVLLDTTSIFYKNNI